MRAPAGGVVRRGTAVVGAGLAAAALGGCASASNSDVSTVASALENPSGDVQARCALLAPGTALEQDASCADALAQVRLPGGRVRSVQVWGGGAQVRMDGDTVFLTQTHGGWRVTAAGCTPQGDAPYRCEVAGP
jgi:hypothetical protein